MELNLNTPKQHAIADALWKAESMNDVQTVIRLFGQEAVTIRDLMVAAAFDNITDVSDAAALLKNAFQSRS